MLWKANMDMQYISESSLAIAQYVTGYVDQGREEQHAGPLAGSLLSLLHLQQAVVLWYPLLVLQGVWSLRG